MAQDDVRVLVVDDVADAAEVLAETLALSGYKVSVASDGAKALASIEAEQPHCVLLDIGMPGMDGLEVARRARQRPDGRDLTVIALSGWGQVVVRPDPRWSLGAGCGVGDPKDVVGLPAGRLANRTCEAHATVRPDGPVFVSLGWREQRTKYAGGTVGNRHLNLAVGFEF